MKKPKKPPLRFSLERRVDLIGERANLMADDLKQIFYALGQIEKHLGQPLRRLDLDGVTDAEKSETQ
jgi:hypothetical protein